MHRTWPRWFVAIPVLSLAIFGATGARGASVTIEARSAPPAYVFAPSTKTIHVGDTVTWTIQPGDPHTITSGTVVGVNQQMPDGKFNSPLVSPPDSWSHKFTTAGTYPYFCKIHADAGMKGTITVVAAAPTPRPTTRATPPPTPQPTLAPTPTPDPTTAVTASPTPSGTPQPVAVVSPVSTAGPTTPPVATPSPDGNGVTPASDAAPLLAGGILIAIAILGAGLWRVRRKS